MERERSQHARLKLAQVMPIFERVWTFKDIRQGFKAMKKLTMGESVWDLYRLNQLKRCWNEGLVLNMEEGQRKRAVMRDIDELYSKKLIARALTCFVEFKEERKQRSLNNDLAMRYYKDHAAMDGKKLAFDALVSFAINAKQSLNAKMQHRFVLLCKSFTSLRDF